MIDAATRATVLTPGSRCAYCGGPAGCVDHRVPTCQGGSNDPGNLVPACVPCNESKGGKTPEQWQAARVRAGESWPPRWDPQYIALSNSRNRDMAASRRWEQTQRFSGRRLQRVRESKKWTVERVADRTGFPVSDIHSLEQGTLTPTPEHLTRLSKAFLLPVDRFLIDAIDTGAMVHRLVRRVAHLEERLAQLEARLDGAA